MSDERDQTKVVEGEAAAEVPVVTAPETTAAAAAVEAASEPSAPAPDDGEADEAAETPADEPEKPKNPLLKWYVVHTYSGYENRAKKSLEERIRTNNLVERFGEVLIPTESVVELGKGGQKKTTKRKFFPGYMLVEMVLGDDTWHLVKGTPKITGFVGGSTRPPAVPEGEVRRLTRQIDEGALKPKPRVVFEDGENVRVVDGPFANFNGLVESVNHDKAKVRVLVSIFGRATPVELDFIQVEKA